MSEAPVIKQRANTIYDNMTFGEEPWRKGREGFREYPRGVPLVDGKPCFDEAVLKDPYDRKAAPPKPYPVVLVQSEEEWEALKGGAGVVQPESGPASVETEDDIRKALYERADVLKVAIDKRWSIERIEKAIADAENVV